MFKLPHPYIICFLAIMMALVSGCEKAPNTSAEKSGSVDVEQAKIFYQSYGKGAPIIIAHGGPGLDRTYLLPQMQALAKDHQVIFYDQRGSGQSIPSPLTESYINMDRFAEDLELLREQLGFDKFILAGHSFGGYLAMWYATTYPDRLHGLILLNSAPMDFAGQQAFIEQFVERTAPFQEQLTPMYDYNLYAQLTEDEMASLYRKVFTVYFSDPAKVENLNLVFEREAALSGFKVAELIRNSAPFKPSFSLAPKLNHLAVPTLIIHGNDDIIPLSTAHDLQQAIPNAKLVNIEACGHFPYIECPDPFFAEMNTFISQLEQG